MSKRRESTNAPPAEPAPRDPNISLRRIAHERLDQLFTEATGGRFYGRVAIEVTFENGQAQVVYRKIDGRDKP